MRWKMTSVESGNMIHCTPHQQSTSHEAVLIGTQTVCESIWALLTPCCQAHWDTAQLSTLQMECSCTMRFPSICYWTTDAAVVLALLQCTAWMRCAHRAHLHDASVCAQQHGRQSRQAGGSKGGGRGIRGPGEEAEDSLDGKGQAQEGGSLRVRTME